MEIVQSIQMPFLEIGFLYNVPAESSRRRLGWRRILAKRSLPTMAPVSQRLFSQEFLLVERLLSCSRASTSCFFVIDDRPEMFSFFASLYRWSFDAFASTPPAVLRFVFLPPALWASEGPEDVFGSHLSPTFSKVCFRASYATWWARFSSSYSSIAESYAFANVRWAFWSDFFRVDGSSDFFGFPAPVVFGTMTTSPMRVEVTDGVRITQMGDPCKGDCFGPGLVIM